MKKIIILVAGVAVLGAPVCVFATGFGTVVSTFESPGAEVYGLSYRPGYVYISVHSGNVVWRTTTTGSVRSYHPLKRVSNRGVTVGKIAGRTYYWIVDQLNRSIYRYVDNSSTVHGSFPIPGNDPAGVAFVNATQMYYTEWEDKALYSLHPMSGSIYSSYTLTFRPGDVAYDEGGYLWIAHPERDSVFKCTREGASVASFSVMSYGHPHACGFDGEYVWVGTNDFEKGVYLILRVNVQEHPSAEPASLGKVKALFR